METVIWTFVVLGGTGLVFGFMLSFASLKLKPKEDPMLEELRDALPGANCGGCGAAGCGQYAEALFAKQADVTACPVGGDPLVKKLASILGTEAEATVRKVAFVKCLGGKSRTKSNYTYIGMQDCFAMAKLAGGGARTCTHGCVGGGTCVVFCVFGAIEMVDGLAVVDRDKCVSCTVCVKSCPRGLIVMVEDSLGVHVGCNSTAAAKTVRECCEVGCIGCKLCQKKCPADAIHMEGSLARTKYESCTNCMSCVAACPRNCIAAAEPQQAGDSPLADFSQRPSR